MTTVCNSSVRAFSSFFRADWSPPKNSIQNVYDLLRAAKDKILSISDPSSNHDFADCLEAMNQITMDDVGLHERVVRNLPCSVCMTIHSSELFDLAVFIIPAGGNIPLHDHPNMTVLSKLLYGRLSAKSFTVSERRNDCLIASPPFTSSYSAQDRPWLLTPFRGNIHEFVAETACVVFDVLMPPYCDPERSCTYYNAAVGADGLWWLCPVPAPTSGLPVWANYRGIRPVEP